MSIRACKNPQITGPVLSREITKLVTECAKADVALFKKQKADADGSLVAFSTGQGGREENGNAATLSRWHRTKRFAPPKQDAPRCREYCRVGVPTTSFLMPYLKGKPAAKARITMLMVLSKPSLLALVPKNVVVVWALYKAVNTGWPRWAGHAAPQRRRHWAVDARGWWPRFRPQTRLRC